MCEDPLSANTYVFVSGREALVVDPGFEENARTVLSLLERLEVSRVLVVLTHCHFDHTASAYLFEERAEIAAHEIDARAIEVGDPETTASLLFGIDVPTRVRVDVKLRGCERLRVGELVFDVIHAPGHTAGSIVLYEPRLKLLVSGDTVFAGGGFGRTDLPTGDSHSLLRTLERLSRMDIERLLPGHGEIVLQGGREHVILAYRLAMREFI